MRAIVFMITLVAAAGGALLAGRATDRFWLAIGLTGAWIALVAVAAFVAGRRRPGFLLPAGAAIAIVGAAMTVLVGLPTLVGKTVDEDVVVGVSAAHADVLLQGDGSESRRPANVERASGRFVSVAHDGEGRAAVVELAGGGRMLTFTRFSTASGPDLRVYLSTGDPARGDLGEYVDLGALKGNQGDQQYEIPRGVDLGRYGVAVVWCRAFSVPFTSARLA